MDQRFKSQEDIVNCKDNSIIISDADTFRMVDSEIVITGKGNILYCDRNVNLLSCRINFTGDNNVVYLLGSKHPYNLNIQVYNNSTCFFGRDVYFNGKLQVICSEGKNVIVGNEALFSFGIWVRTADPHLVYSIVTKERLNLSKSVFIGDHVWIGQNALILKGSKIHSGSIVGGGAVVAGKRIPSNTSYAGNPACKIAEDVFWDSRCVHKWLPNDTENNKTYNKSKPFIYKENAKTLQYEKLDKELSHDKSAEERLKILTDLAEDNNPQRFSRNASKDKKRKIWKILSIR